MKVTISAEPLGRLLRALVGPPHLIQELLVCMSLAERGLSSGSNNDPIGTVIAEYNAGVRAINVHIEDSQ